MVTVKRGTEALRPICSPRWRSCAVTAVAVQAADFVISRARIFNEAIPRRGEFGLGLLR
jgi:hypothetical protein